MATEHDELEADFLGVRGKIFILGADKSLHIYTIEEELTTSQQFATWRATHGIDYQVVTWGTKIIDHTFQSEPLLNADRFYEDCLAEQLDETQGQLVTVQAKLETFSRLDDNCAFCLDILMKPDTETMICKCGHAFHMDCLAQFMQSGHQASSDSCPLCMAGFQSWLRESLRVGLGDSMERMLNPTPSLPVGPFTTIVRQFNTVDADGINHIGESTVKTDDHDNPQLIGLVNLLGSRGIFGTFERIVVEFTYQIGFRRSLDAPMDVFSIIRKDDLCALLADQLKFKAGTAHFAFGTDIAALFGWTNFYQLAKYHIENQHYQFILSTFGYHRCDEFTDSAGIEYFSLERVGGAADVASPPPRTHVTGLF